MKTRQTVLPETPVEKYFWPGSGGWRRAELGTDPAERVSPAGVSGAGEGPGWAQTPSRGLHYTSCDAGKTASQTGSCGEERLRQAKKRRPDATEPEVAKSKPEVHRKEPAASGAPSGGASQGGTGERNQGVRDRGGWRGLVWELGWS